tara:strand:+ start:322 stop:459 length:138 start_codon:yes stop_codon:yes gene_type:complete
MSLHNNKKVKKGSDISERSEEEILEEEKKNQQTVDIYIQSDKNWS